MLLAPGLQKQGQAYRQGLDKELEKRVEKIQTLEQELQASKMRAEEAKRLQRGGP